MPTITSTIMVTVQILLRFLERRRGGRLGLVVGGHHVGDVEDLAGVHEPMRVEGALDAAHHVQRLRAELFDQGAFFAEADAVLALVGKGFFSCV